MTSERKKVKVSKLVEINIFIAILAAFLLCGCYEKDIFEGLDYEGQYVTFYRSYGPRVYREFYRLTRISEEEYKAERLVTN